MITRYPAPTVDKNGHGDVVQHAHPDSSYVHVDIPVTGGTGYDFILIDLSDTTNWPHDNTGTIHIEEFYVDVDAQVNADYQLNFGYLANVSGTSGDFREITHISGTKTVGQQKSENRKFYPNGPRLSGTYVTTSDITTGDTAFNTATNLRSALNVTTASVPSGSGDFVLRVTTTGGANTDFDIEINISYHTHP